jgi:aspartate kinase
MNKQKELLIVQKFGGTSVGSLERINEVALRIIDTIEENKKQQINTKIVAVVSAMSGETNKLISFAKHFSDTPTESEMDKLLSSGERVTSSLLAIALNSKNYSAVSMSGRQAGILTDGNHTKARIEDINPEAIFDKLNNENIVIVAGFQGIGEDGQITTLGRGGSDLSAVAIAGALKADLCEIYTDVDGIYTTDPRIEPKAKKLELISYDEMLEMASLGAKVLQSRSVEMAKKLDVNLVTRSSFNKNSGTLITSEEKIEKINQEKGTSTNMEKPLLSGIALDKNQARISLIDVTDRTGIASDIFSALAKENINVDMIVQTIGARTSSQDEKTNVAFTVTRDEVAKTKTVLETFKANNSFADMQIEDNIVKVSVVGVGMKSHTGVAAKAFETLANENINIMMISTSEIKISMIIDEKYSELAVRSLHSAYELDK